LGLRKEVTVGVTTQRLTDPVCGMSVRLDAAEADGLVLEHHGVLYAFCRAECRDAFVADPHRYADRAPIASAAPEGGLPVIDEGMRRWYESCSCCLGDTYPDVKAALDAERAAASQRPAGPGVCEVAEGAGA
jgi:YHS domain-containing protein